MPAISYFAELLALVIARPVGKFVKLGHRIGGREPRVLARKNPVSAPRLTLSALRTGHQLRLLGGDDTLTKLAVAPRESAPLTLRARRCRIFEMMRQVRAKMSDSCREGAIFIGWNSMRFDEAMLRQAYYKSLLPLYQTNRNGNGRADLMRMVAPQQKRHHGIH